MKPILVSILLFVPFALGARYFFVCEMLQWCDRASLAVGDLASDLAVDLPGGRTARLSFGAYPVGADQPARSPARLATLDSLAALLDRYPDHSLRLTGPTRPGERGGGYYRDLGIARAADVSRELQRRGVSGERFELDAYVVSPGEPAVLRAALEPSGAPRNTTGLPTAESLLDSTVLRGLRFETGSTALSPDAELAEYARALVTIMRAEPDRQLTLIGHTDDRAVPEYNDSLGRWRAEAVARYFTQVGYDRPITVLSRGEREPVAPNDTPEGRFANRRVEVRID